MVATSDREKPGDEPGFSLACGVTTRDETGSACGWDERLVANNEAFRQLSFFVDRTLRRPAPAYDMLPMLYTPLPGREVSARAFSPALPQPAQPPSRRAACAAVISFWASASEDRRISEAFRAVSRESEVKLRLLADRVSRPKRAAGSTWRSGHAPVDAASPCTRIQRLGFDEMKTRKRASYTSA